MLREIAMAAALMGAATSAFGWEHSARSNPIDDSTIYTISVSAAEATLDRFGSRGTADLVIQCENNTTLLAVLFSNLYVSDHGNWGIATFRADSEPAFQQKMIGSNDHASLAVRGEEAIRLIKKFMSAEELFTRVLPVNESSTDLTFDVRGAQVALKSIREKCGW